MLYGFDTIKFLDSCKEFMLSIRNKPIGAIIGTASLTAFVSYLLYNQINDLIWIPRATKFIEQQLSQARADRDKYEKINNDLTKNNSDLALSVRETYEKLAKVEQVRTSQFDEIGRLNDRIKELNSVKGKDSIIELRQAISSVKSGSAVYLLDGRYIMNVEHTFHEVIKDSSGPLGKEKLRVSKSGCKHSIIDSSNKFSNSMDLLPGRSASLRLNGIAYRLLLKNVDVGACVYDITKV